MKPARSPFFSAISSLSLPILIAVALFFSLSFYINAAFGPFNRDLSLGSTGRDVQALQQALNSNSSTRVAPSGPGSPGLETRYFGQLTRIALIKFQQAHALVATGILDGATRDVFNSTNSSSNTSSTGTTSSPQDALNATYRASITMIPGFPYIDSVSSKSVKNGDTITIYGGYFSTTTPNIVTMTYNQASVVSQDGTTLKVKVNSYLEDLYKKQTQGMDSDDKEKVRKKIGKTPLFITVNNGKGASNPYMIYFSIK